MACRNLLKFCVEVMPWVPTLYLLYITGYSLGCNCDGCPKFARWDNDDDAYKYNQLRMRLSILSLAMLRKLYQTSLSMISSPISAVFFTYWIGRLCGCCFSCNYKNIIEFASTSSSHLCLLHYSCTNIRDTIFPVSE
jgi:hypothetical protein